jgi:hypothetical protein
MKQKKWRPASGGTPRYKVCVQRSEHHCNLESFPFAFSTSALEGYVLTSFE